MYKVIVEYNVGKLRIAEQICKTKVDAQELWLKLNKEWNTKTTISFPLNHLTWRIISCNSIVSIWIEKSLEEEK